MAIERRTTTTTTDVPTTERVVHDREVVREHHTGDRGIGTLIVGALLVLVIAFLGVYFVNALSDGDGEVIPSEMNVDITDQSGGAEAPADSGGAEAPADSGGAEAPADSGGAEAPADSTGQ